MDMAPFTVALGSGFTAGVDVQGLYLKYAKKLIEQGDAYYCFCDKDVKRKEVSC